MSSEESALALRSLAAEDAETLAAWATDPIFCAHAGWRAQSARDGALPWWRESIERPDPTLLRLAAVTAGELVGYVDLHGASAMERELGFLIGPSARWGQGLGTAAAWAGLAHGFEVLGLTAIWAEALQANLASLAILRRVGMRRTGLGDSETFLGTPSRWVRFRLEREGHASGGR